MRILFCNIAWMNYYKGIVWGKDEPQNGGSYVKETLDMKNTILKQYRLQKNPDIRKGNIVLALWRQSQPIKKLEIS